MQIAKLFFLFDIWRMSLKAKVKVGRITNLSEARYCAGMGVDMLGFPVGEEGLKPEQYKQMIEWVAGPEFVLEAHHFRSIDLKTITDNYPGHYIQIGIHQLSWTANKDLNFILTINPGDWVNIYGEVMGQENIKFVELTNASDVRTITTYFPVLVNVDSMALEDILKLDTGIAITGSDEEKPGIKEYNKVAEVLEALEVE
jgi:phosphoribosylanthranilate isomerase